MTDEVRVDDKEICAGIPRSGTTMMLRAMIGLPPASTTPPGDLGKFAKTHSFHPSDFAGAKRAVFMFGDPVSSVLSTRAQRFTAGHFVNCGAADRDPSVTDIFAEDALNYEKMFDAWTRRQTFDLICVRYETLHDNIDSIEGFFGRHLYIPPRRPRQTEVDADSEEVRQISQTYARLVAKVQSAPDVAIFRAGSRLEIPDRAISQG